MKRVRTSSNQLLKINNDIITGLFIEKNDPNTLIIQTLSKSVYTFTGTSSSILNNFSAITFPTLSDDNSSGYVVGSRWLDTANDILWFCTDSSVGAAIWIIETQYGIQDLSDTGTVTYNTNLGPKAEITSPVGNLTVNLTNLPSNITREGFLNVKNTNGITIQFQVAASTTNVYIVNNGQGDTAQITTGGATARDSFAWVWDGTDLWLTRLENFTQT